jgi:hypothetical protein
MSAAIDCPLRLRGFVSRFHSRLSITITIDIIGDEV